MAEPVSGAHHATTLGLNDDLDGVEVVRDRDRVFDVKVSYGRRGDRVTPAFDMRVLEHGRTKSNLRRLDVESGLRMPGTIFTLTGRVAASFKMEKRLGVICHPFQIPPRRLSGLASHDDGGLGGRHCSPDLPGCWRP
jgi:hypothetical protein